jgi:ribosomal protein L7/L12
MAELLLTEWKKGLKKISAVKLLQERAGLTLTVAKESVDRLLKHESVGISMSSVEEATAIAEELRKLGIICHVTNNIE